MTKVTPHINLVKDKQASFLDKFINWTLTIGRLVVVLTELIVLSAFVYRFTLDSQIIDLHSTIKQEQAIVSYLKNSEATYRNLQERLALSSKLSQQEATPLKTYEDITSFTPKDLILDSFYIGGNTIEISATVQSSYSLNQFINSLKNYPATASVSLNTIENKPSSNTIAFNVTVNLK